MRQLNTFIGLLTWLLFTAGGIYLLGWWMAVILAVGLLWQIAGHMTTRKPLMTQQPDPRNVASQPSRPASTVTWQETVEAIERARPVANTAKTD